MTLQSLVGVELPIIQAPMAGVQGSALAVAVSHAGGLGSLPAPCSARMPCARSWRRSGRRRRSLSNVLRFNRHARPSRSPQRASVERTPSFSLRENAIAKEPGSS
jgi:nitronate monooxygenase